METENIGKISNLYTKLTYFDEYSGSIGFIVLITIVTILICVYCYVMIRAETIKKDWAQQRCKPNIIPFAGIINKPDNMTATEYTVENFGYCTNDIMKSVSKSATSPFSAITDQLTNIAGGFGEALNSAREITSSMRGNMGSLGSVAFEKIKSILLPLQNSFTILKTLLSKLKGFLTACLYTVFGMYATLKSLMGSIAELCVTILITLAGIILAFFAMSFIPFVGPVFGVLAAGMTVGYLLSLGLLVPLLKVLNSASKTPSASLKACFDPSLEITMNDGNKKQMVDIQVGDVLSGSNVVTAKFKLTSRGSSMYNLNNVIVSESHTVEYKDKWIPVSKHPDAVKIENYEEPYIYCLNTSSKQIFINGLRFVDWDEIYTNEHIDSLKKNAGLSSHKLIHAEMDSGFPCNTQIQLQDGTTKAICDIQVGDILLKGEKVYGVVEINGGDVNQYKYNFGNNIFVDGGPNLTICDRKIDFVTSMHFCESMRVLKREQEPKLYHLLTDKQTFYYKGICFYDYNASIDLFLHP